MTENFLNLLCDPDTGEELTLTVQQRHRSGRIESGELRTARGRVYPIINGIPRFVATEHYSSSFGFEWRKWSRVQFEEENAGKPMAGHTRRMFDTILDLGERDLTGAVAVEFGCGPGRFLDMVRRRGGRAVGIDMSLAVESARENFIDDPDVLIVQGDILNPPFRPGVFDVAYSIGVLHHTPQPALGFRMLASTLKPGGHLACCVYHNRGFYAYPSVALYRWLHNHLKSLLGNRPAVGYSFLYAYLLYYLFLPLRFLSLPGRAAAHLLEKYLLPGVPLADPRWRFLDVFDAITPCYASTHTAEEVQGWFRGAGCSQIRQTAWAPTSWVGRKGDGTP